MGAITKEQFISYIENLTLVQAAELVKELEEKFGVSASAPVAMMASPAAAAAPVEEQTEFDVILETVPEKKLDVIREVRALTGLGLKEAKDLVDGAPKTLKSGVSKSEAESIKAKLVAIGAGVKLK